MINLVMQYDFIVNGVVSVCVWKFVLHEWDGETESESDRDRKIER